MRNWAVLALSMSLQSTVYAHSQTRSGDGKFIHWDNPHLELAGNPKNQVGIDEGFFWDSVIRGLNRWQEGSQGAIKFDYWQGDNPTPYAPNTSYNGLSSIYFASNDNTGAPPVSSAILGMTQVWYNAENAEILEADIVLNDIHFKFTSNPTHTSGPGTGASGTYPFIFLENVLTHELGHAYGLSHSGLSNSTMLFLEAPDQAHLSCDDQIGIRSAYENQAAIDSGAIEGRVLAPSGQPVFGANVAAISKDRGSVMGSSLTDKSGNFRIASLEPGSYFLYAESYLAGAGTLSDYYQSINPYVCPGGTRFGRTFFTGSDGHQVHEVSVSNGNSEQVGGISVSCAGSGASVSAGWGGNTLASPRLVSVSGFGSQWVDRFSALPGSLFYRMSEIQGTLKVRTSGHSLYSPVSLQLELYDSSGVIVSGQKTFPVYQSESGYKLYETEAVFENLVNGDYVLRVSGQTLGNSFFPGLSSSIDSVPFFVVSASLGTPSSDYHPEHPKCRSVEDYGEYQSPPGGPPIRVFGKKKIEETGFLGCGVVRNAKDPQSERIGIQALAVWVVLLGLTWGFYRLRFRRAKTKMNACMRLL